MDGGFRGRLQTTVEWGAYKLTQVFLPEPHPPCRMHANNHLAHTYHPLPHSPIPPPHTPFWSPANDEQLLKKLRADSNARCLGDSNRFVMGVTGYGNWKPLGLRFICNNLTQVEMHAGALKVAEFRILCALLKH